jgi:hypothetical protein
MRTFTITKVVSGNNKIKTKNIGGRFNSSNPSSAAKKAGSSICKRNGISSQCHFNIYIQETTQNSSKKLYGYSYKRIYNPKTVEKGGQMITFNFETITKPLRKSKSRSKRSKRSKRSDGGEEDECGCDEPTDDDDDLFDGQCSCMRKSSETDGKRKKSKKSKRSDGKKSKKSKRSDGKKSKKSKRSDGKKSKKSKRSDGKKSKKSKKSKRSWKSDGKRSRRA